MRGDVALERRLSLAGRIHEMIPGDPQAEKFLSCLSQTNDLIARSGACIWLAIFVSTLVMYGLLWCVIHIEIVTIVDDSLGHRVQRKQTNKNFRSRLEFVIFCTAFLTVSPHYPIATHKYASNFIIIAQQLSVRIVGIYQTTLYTKYPYQSTTTKTIIKMQKMDNLCQRPVFASKK